jgi:NAD(P) transhydrogenase subunit alpha
VTDINHLIELLTIFLLAVFVGFEVISKVPTMIHGIVVAGAIVATVSLFRSGAADTGMTIVAIAAVTLGAINVFGGFSVTERMLEMFRGKGGGK